MTDLIRMNCMGKVFKHYHETTREQPSVLNVLPLAAMKLSASAASSAHELCRECVGLALLEGAITFSNRLKA